MGKVSELDKSGAGLYEGFDSMLAVGEAPWHYAANSDLITLKDKGTVVHSDEVNKLAGLDWEVGQYPSTEVLQRPFQGLPSDVYNVREDKNLVIGRVKQGYHVFQNEEAPVFMDSLVDSGDVHWETAGSLYGGGRVWWLAKMPEGITIGDDEIDSFLLLMNSHDGSVSITVAVTPIRVVCQNTLAYGLREAKRTTKIRHTKNAPIKFAEARRALEVGFKYNEELAEIGNRMLDVKVSDDELAAWLNGFDPVPEKRIVDTEKGKKVTNNPAITMVKNRHGVILDLYQNNPTQQSIKGTLWGGVQAVQFFSDHVASSKSVETNFQARIAGKGLGSKAFDAAMAMVK